MNLFPFAIAVVDDTLLHFVEAWTDRASLASHK
jgi:quinol monooxygenase YgiN